MKRDKPQVVLLIVPRSCQPADGDERPSRSKTLSAIRAQRIPSQREIPRLMEGAIDDLPERFRMVFVMREIEEFEC